MVLTVLAEAAALAASSAECTLAAVEPPTLLTVAATEPEPLAETSPVSAEIPVPAGVDHESTPEPLVLSIWPLEPSACGSVQTVDVVIVAGA